MPSIWKLEQSEGDRWVNVGNGGSKLETPAYREDRRYRVSYLSLDCPENVRIKSRI
jgi:O-methyltransferase involved in polyketide biosynthesis